MAALFDLEKHFVFYEAYHSDPTNVFIHLVFVWPIFFSFQLLAYAFPLSFHIATSLAIPLVFNFGFLVAVTYSAYYILLERRVGSLAAVLCILCWVGSNILGSRLGSSLSWKVGAGVHVLCWSVQFIGHGVFERRAPALLDNLPQALLAGPFFVLLEVVRRVFAYEPYPGFYEKAESEVETERKRWLASKSKTA